MILKRLILIVVILILAAGSISAGDRKKSNFKRYGVFSSDTIYFDWVKRYKQGCNMKVWLSNSLKMGRMAWDLQAGGSVPPEPCTDRGIGMEYPVGSCIEHLYGGGPWIGGIINGVRLVSPAYYAAEGTSAFLPELKDSARDKIWRTSTIDRLYDLNFDPPHLLKQTVNIKGYDDDHDGKIDEDDLDGLDNDGDWNPLTDDVGSDGIPDSLEIGCDGKTYDPVTNPDPAYDNYDPSQFDICRTLPNGSYPHKDDKNIYTEKNGIPDHGEPHVDEDYGAVSENDVYLSSTDTNSTDFHPYFRHSPMGIKIIQHSYSWCGTFAEGILPMDYWFVNIGKNIIKDVYVAFWVDMDVGPVNTPWYWWHNFSGYYPDLRTAYTHNAEDRGSTPAGVTLLAAPRPLDSLRYVWDWIDYYSVVPIDTVDSIAYSYMSCEHYGYKDCISPNQSPYLSPTDPSDTHFFFSFGPFSTMNPGDSLKISVALIAGEALDIGPNNLRQNAKKALVLYARGWLPPVSLPSPPLTVTPGFKKVTLEWGHHICPSCVDPTQVWDDSSRIAEVDSMRSANPPPGHKHGGRIFEGYRVYRSEDLTDSPPISTFTLLKQYDVKGDQFEYNAGIDTVFVDSGLVRGKRYWYAVTAFGIPEITTIDIPDGSGHIRKDTLSLYGEDSETNIRANAKSLILPFSVSDKLGEVLAVPNPYRVDKDYTYENGGWEGRATDWSENKRLLKFIHLPPKCTIRIFTLAGDLVTTLEHDDPVRGEVSWNLLSESNRAIASGVYVFTVESDFGRQIGKFVVIR